MTQFCIVEEATGETWGIRQTEKDATATANVFRLGTNKHFVVLEMRPVYSTSGSEYVLSSPPTMLKESWERFRALRDKLLTRDG